MTKWTAFCSLIVAGALLTSCGGGGGSSPASQSQDNVHNYESAPAYVSGDCAPLQGVFSELLTLTNDARADVGAAPLRFSFQLGQSAQHYAQAMATDNFFSHDGKDGSNFVDRIQAAGYPSGAKGENLAAGQSTAQSAFRGWMNSTSHRNNLLSKAFTEVGFGYYNASGDSTHGHYWVQHLGKPSSGQTGSGAYIPDSCRLSPTQADETSSTVVAGKSTINVGNQTTDTAHTYQAAQATLPAGRLANQVSQLVSGQGERQSVPEPVLLTGLGLFGVVILSSRQTNR